MAESGTTAGPPLDEIQWRTPPPFEGGVHNNSVLYYFALSPFYDKTSNNEVLFQQGLNNANMTQYLATRELFEGRLKTMSGLEFVVAQEPAETGPNAGTGIWVINKQNRRKRQGEEDEVTVLGTYFISGENIYMAPSLSDILNSRLVRPPPPSLPSQTNFPSPGLHCLLHRQDPLHGQQAPKLLLRHRPHLPRSQTQTRRHHHRRHRHRHRHRRRRAQRPRRRIIPHPRALRPRVPRPEPHHGQAGRLPPVVDGAQGEAGGGDGGGQECCCCGCSGGDDGRASAVGRQG